MKNYYKILGIDVSATEEDIKHAYRKLMKENHPDLYDQENEEAKKLREERVKDMNEAYEILSNADKRKNYDSNFQKQVSTISANSQNPVNQSSINFGKIFDDYFSSTHDNNLFNKTLEEYDELIEFINEMDKEFKNFGLTSTKARESLKGKRGMLTSEQIRQYKNNITNQLKKVKESAKIYDEFKSEYDITKRNMEIRGVIIPNFEELLNPKERWKTTKEEVREARVKLTDIVNNQVKVINSRIQTLNMELQKRGFSLIDIMKQKNMRTSNELTPNDLEEIDKMIKLIDEINKNLSPLKITLIEILKKMQKPISQINIKHLELINKNVLELFNNNDMLAKWKLTHMTLDELEETNQPKK